MNETVAAFLSPASPYAVVIRAGLWFAISIVIIASTDTVRQEPRKLKENLGMFILFLVLSSGLMYLLFGFVPIV